MSEEVTLDDFAEQGVNNDVSDEHPRLGSLPDDWKISELANIAEVVGGSTPSTSNEDYWGGGIPWATPTDITALSGNTISDTEDTITEEGLESASTHLLPPKSVLMTSRATIGKCAINTVEMATNQGFKSLVPSDEIEPWYLYYRMLDTAAFLNSLGSGSTFDEVSKTDVQSVDIPVPPLPEQRKIATVLYTVDRAIEKTEEIIEQYRRIYVGLLQSEFHEGKEDNTKDAGALGRVPASWSVVPISEVAEVTMGNSPKSEHYNSEGDGLPFYQGANEFGERSPTPDRWCSAPKKVGKPGDTLLNIRSHTNVGKVNKAHHECCIGRGLAAVTPSEKIDEDYLYHHLRERENYINSIASGSTFDSVNTEEVESVKITLPSMDTQLKIASSLNNIQTGIIKQKAIVGEFGRLKRGLMQDLLSGTVRTTNTNIEVPDEIAQHG